MKNGSKSIFDKKFENFRKICLLLEKLRGVSGKAVALSLGALKRETKKRKSEQQNFFWFRKNRSRL
tara:strand:+ start:574 stop:771 length:198 start_codon:yes stop_codon:yes gene_type:complete